MKTVANDCSHSFNMTVAVDINRTPASQKKSTKRISQPSEVFKNTALWTLKEKNNLRSMDFVAFTVAMQF